MFKIWKWATKSNYMFNHGNENLIQCLQVLGGVVYILVQKPERVLQRTCEIRRQSKNTSFKDQYRRCSGGSPCVCVWECECVPSEALLGSGERRETASWSFLGRALSRAVMTRPTVRETMDSGGTDSHINRWSSSIASSSWVWAIYINLFRLRSKMCSDWEPIGACFVLCILQQSTNRRRVLGKAKLWCNRRQTT